MTPALEWDKVSKSFGGIVAASGVSLAVNPGEVLAVVGENGAGKSTLVNLACGLYRPDSGVVRAGGTPLRAGDPRAAIDAGVGVVYQHFMLVPPLTVWENVVLGQEPRRAGPAGKLGALDRQRARHEVTQAARKAGLALDVDARVDSIGVAMQQRVEIVKQLWRGARVLILDEPTAVLAPIEADELLATARSLAAEGRSVVFISHKLREVLAVADRVAVIRRGRVVQVTSAKETSASQLAEAVMGITAGAVSPDLLREAAAAGLAPAPPPQAAAAVSGTPRLIAKTLVCSNDRGRPALRGLTFSVNGGELLGVAGVDGNGQSELAEVLTGLRSCLGTLKLDGNDGFQGGWATSPGAARRAGVVHLPEDRLRRALCLPLSVEENVALGRHGDAPYARGMRIDRPGRKRRAAELIAQFDVRPPDPSVRAGALSGGNQQKLVAARELAGGAPPSLVVAVQPTRGLDLGAAKRVHEALRAARDGGAAVLVVSLDLDELRAISDRILVLHDGRAAGEAPPTASDEHLGRLMLGQVAHA